MAYAYHYTWNRRKLDRECGTEEACTSFAEARGLLPTTKQCPVHHVTLNLVDGGMNFRCRKCDGSGRQSKWSRSLGTWFEQARLDKVETFSLMYSYAHRESYNRAVLEARQMDVVGSKMLSHNTVCDWYQYCRETTVSHQIGIEQEAGQIGGPDVRVQIDESKFGKRKYGKGRQVEGHWVLGMIAEGSEDLRLELCPDNVRSAEALIPIIQKHVAPGSEIHTDMWKAYSGLGRLGYTHKVVNHSDPDARYQFVAEDGTHTQRIESQWRVVKQFYQGHRIPAEQFADHVVAYQWFRRCQKQQLDPFEELINSVRSEYGV